MIWWLDKWALRRAATDVTNVSGSLDATVRAMRADGMTPSWVEQLESAQEDLARAYEKMRGVLGAMDP